MVRLAAALALLLSGAAGAAPSRVVSVNLCTDQLALLIAAPGQLASVSYVAADPRVSLMADQAAKLPLNHARAEEIFLSRPDLVLASTYSDPALLALLARLGLRVETLPPARRIADMRENITRMGALLDRPDRAAQLLAGFDADLARIGPGTGRLATSYGANGFANGAGTLSGDVMRRAGLMLLAERLGLPQGGQVALEQLVMADPDLIVTGTRETTPSRAEALLDHPAFAAIPARQLSVPDRDWICGLPAVAGVAARLAQ
ncbi:MAG: ABC transporter substrate-binding protein [Paracoccus sp. (in: a-proteobacteria)]